MSDTCCGVVADGADRAAAQPHPVGRGNEGRQHDAGIDRGVEERIEMVVHERPLAPLEQQPVATVVGAEHEEHRRRLDPGIVRQQGLELLALALVGDDHDVGLLQVRLRRRRQGDGAERLDQRRVDRLVEVAAHDAPVGHVGQHIDALRRLGRRAGAEPKRGFEDGHEGGSSDRDILSVRRCWECMGNGLASAAPAAAAAALLLLLRVAGD